MKLDLSRRGLVVAAVVMAVLAVSAQPVTAASAGFAVGSEHTSDSDFQNGTLSQTVVSGSGDAASITQGSYSDVEESTVDSSVIGRWALNEGSGSSASDSVGSRDATITGATWTDGIDGNALDFGGGNHYYEHTDKQFSDSDDYTLSAWVKAPDGGSFSGGLWHGSESYDTIHFRSSSSNKIYFQQRGFGRVEIGSFDGYADGEWHHLAIRVDGSQDLVEVYADGNLEGSNTISAGTAIDIDGFGRDREHYTFNGQADEIQIYNTRLSESEIDRFVKQTAYDTGWYESANHSVSDAVSAWTKLTLTNATANVEWQAWNSSSATWQVVNSSQFDSTGNYTLDISGTSYSKWRVNVSFDKTGSNPTAELHDEGILVENQAPIIDNASATPDTTGESVGSPVTLSIDVSDRNFENAETEELTVDFYVDGEKKGSRTLSANGTASYELSGVSAGTHNWHVVVSDEHGGQSTSDTFEFTTASTLRILDEQNPDTLVKGNVTVTVRLYSNQKIVQRTVSDGTVNLTGLPLDTAIVATTEADSWVDRRVLIRNLTQQQEIYLLNSSSNYLSITFDLQDKSGDFPGGESQLYVQKAINTSDTDGLEWQTVTGDYFGSDGRFPTKLLYNQRYRLVIQSGDGDRRVLGSYIPYESGTFPITIGKIIWDPPKGDSVVFEARLQDVTNQDTTYENASKEIYLRYDDTNNSTTQKLKINISVRGTNEQIYETTVNDVDSYSSSIPLTENESKANLVVNVTAVRDGKDITWTKQLGEVRSVGIPIDPKWASLLAQLSVLTIIGLVAGAMPKKGGLVVVPVAFGITWLGWWQIHPAALGIAGVTALFAAARSSGGVS